MSTTAPRTAKIQPQGQCEVMNYGSFLSVGRHNLTSTVGLMAT